MSEQEHRASAESSGTADPASTARARSWQTLTSDSDSRAGKNMQSACRFVAAWGAWAGCGLSLLGVLAGLDRLLPAATATFTASDWLRGLVRAGYLVVGHSLAGAGLAACSRLSAVAILEYFDRANRARKQALRISADGINLLERIASSLERRAATGDSPRAAPESPARALGEIDRAIRDARWGEAETLLDQFEADEPDDPRAAKLRHDLAMARHKVAETQLEQLEASREANDPEHVLEVYQVAAPLLEQGARATLERDLSRWFLSLIHRRLRTGKIQPDLVSLAERVAGCFAATTEGASLRASLPMLRRSVGLCPRCGQAYTETGEVCPKCHSSK
jgi:hypothetical protein